MDLTITTLEGKDAGKVKLNEEIFGLDPRDDILQRVVRWQLARRQQGSHKAQGRGDVSRTGSKMYKQKGTGRARHHSARAPQFRGGGQAHGPVVVTTTTICRRRFALLACVMPCPPRPRHPT